MTSNLRNAAQTIAILVVGALVVGFAWTLTGVAQDKPPNPDKLDGASKSASADDNLAAQVRELQAKVAKLDAALKQGHKGAPSATSDTSEMGKGIMGMGGMQGKDPAEMQKMMQRMMQMMGGGQGKEMRGMAGMSGMGMEDDDMEMMGMMGMGTMKEDGMKGLKGVERMQKTAALPGFPGASHIYHIGATGFFLDHPDHITLTTDQQRELNDLQETALLEKASSRRKIDEAEQELWTLTAADQPDAVKIETKVSEIEQLRGDQRLAFIRAVGEAAKVLTDEQRAALLGTAAEKADTHTGH